MILSNLQMQSELNKSHSIIQNKNNFPLELTKCILIAKLFFIIMIAYFCLQKVELPFEIDRYPSSRYSLVSVSPQTGRRQQIRKHFKHISHHLIGDTTHGNGKHNRFFREQYDIHRLMLTSQKLCIDHPVTKERLCFEAIEEPEWVRLYGELNWG